MPTFEQFKKKLQDAGLNWSDDKIKAFIESQISTAEQGVSSPTIQAEFGPQYKVLGAVSERRTDQSAVMDFLGNALWGATEGGSWGLATGIDIAKGGEFEKAVSLGYSDEWDEESFAGKAGYILGNSIAMLGTFAATGGLISTVGGATRVAAPSLAKAGAKQLAKATTDNVVKGLGRTAVDKALKDAVLKTVSGETGEVFATAAMRTAADDILSIGRGQWRNVPLKEKMLSYGAGRGSKQIARRELMEEAHGNISKDIQKRLVENLAKGGASKATIANISDDVLIAKSEQLAKEVMTLAQTYNSRNFNLALSAKIAQAGKGLTPVEISKAAQRWGAGIAEGTLFAVHGLGTHSWRNISYNIFADKDDKKLVDHEGHPLTASGVVAETLMSFATGTALGSVARFIGQSAGKESSGIFHPTRIEKFRTYAGKEMNVSHEAMEKTGWLAKDFPTIIKAIKRRITPTKYKSKEQLKRMAAKDRESAQDAIRIKSKIIWDSADGGKGMTHLLPDGFKKSTFKVLSKNVNRSIEETGQLIKFLSNTEKEFSKEIVPWLGREMTQDFFQSLPRMVVGSTIMNAQTFYQNYQSSGTLWGPDPKETIAHILTGMWFTKKKHIFLGGEKTTYFNMQNYRKYMNGLEVLGYDTKHVRKWKAFVDGDILAPQRQLQIKSQHKGFKALIDTFTDKSGESLFKDDNQRLEKRQALEKAGQELPAPINKHIDTDRQLAAGDKTKIEDIKTFEFKKDLIESSIKHLYPDKAYEDMTWNEYVEMKKRVLELKIDGKDTTVDNLQQLIQKTFSDERDTTTGLYSEALGDFFDSLANTFKLSRTGTIDNRIIINPEFAAMLRKQKRTSDREDQEYIQIVLDAFESAVSKDFIREADVKTEGLSFEMTDELMANLKGQVVDSLERLHMLQFGTSDWRSEFFGGAVEKSTTRDKDSKLVDMFVDVGMLGHEVFYDAIQTNLLFKRLGIAEKMLTGDSVEEGLMSETERTEYKKIHDELGVFFNKGLPLIDPELGGTVKEQQKASDNLERIFNSFNIENEVNVVGEKKITLEDANKMIKRLTDYTGDLFINQESYTGFENYLGKSSMVRALGELNEHHGMKSALLAFLRSNSNLGTNKDIKVWQVKDAIGAINAAPHIGDTKKAELVKFYEEFVENLKGAPRISESDRGTMITSGLAVEVISDMASAYNTLAVHEHLKTGNEFAIRISSSNVLLQKIAKSLGKDIKEVQKQLDDAKTKEIDANVKTELELQKIRLDNKNEILDHLEESYSGLYEEYLRALEGGDTLLLRQLVTQRRGDLTVKEIVDDMYKRLVDREGFDDYDSLNNFAYEIREVHLQAVRARNDYLETRPGDYPIIRSSASSVKPINTRKDIAGLSRMSFAEKHKLSTVYMRDLFSVSEDILRGAREHARPNVQNRWDEYTNRAISIIGNRKSIDMQEIIMNKSLEDLAVPLATKRAKEIWAKNKSHNVDLGENRKKEEYRSENMQEIKEDLLRLYTRESTKRKINTVQFINGELVHDLAVTSQWGHGFDGVFDRLGLHSWESGDVHLLVQSSVDGVMLSQMSKARLAAIDKAIEAGIKIDFSKAKNEYLTSSDKERLAEIRKNHNLAGTAKYGLPQYFTIMMDEKTILVVQNSPKVKQRLTATFAKGGNIRKELESFIPNNTKHQQGFYELIDTLVDKISVDRRGESHNDHMKVLMYLTRMIGDQPALLLEEIQKGNLRSTANAVKLHRRLKTLTPKGIATNDRILGLTLKRLRAMEADHKELNNKSEVAFYRDAKKRMIRNTTDSKGKKRKLKLVTVEDESELSKAFFSEYESQLSAAKEEYGKDFDKDIFDKDNAELDKAKKTMVDGEMYVTLDTMVTELLAFGESRDAFVVDKSGKIIGVNFGALKPTIHERFIGKDGSITVYTAKTAMKWHPVIEKEILNPRKIDGLLFNSANKINSVSSSRGGLGEARRLELGLNEKIRTASKSFKENYHKDRWIPNLVEVIKDVDPVDFDANIVEVSHASFMVKSVARPHEPTLTRASLTFLDEGSLGELSKWTNQENNLARLRDNFGVIEHGPPGLTDVANMLMGIKDESHISDTIIDTIVRGGWILPQAYEKTINQKLMAAATRAGNYTGEAREGAYSVMTAGNGLSRPWRTADGIQRQYGGSGISNYAADKEIKWNSIARPSFIWKIGKEEFMVYSEVDNKTNENTIHHRGIALKKGALGRALLKKLGIEDLISYKTDATDEYKLPIPIEFVEELENIIKKSIFDTHKEFSDSRNTMGKETMRDLLTYLERGYEQRKDKKTGKMEFVYRNSEKTLKETVGATDDFRLTQGEHSVAFNKGKEIINDVHNVLKKIQKDREKKQDEWIHKFGNTRVRREQFQNIGDTLKQLSTVKKITERVFEGIWVAKRDLRIPKDGVESVVVTKIEKIINKLRGTVSEINGIDATLVQDADFDLDKSIEWWGMPVKMAKHIDKLSGFSHFPEGDRYERENVDFKMLGGLNQGEEIDTMLRDAALKGKELEKMRGIIIGTHHILSFFQNFKVNNASVLTDLKPGMGRRFRVENHQFISDGPSSGELGAKNVDLIIGEVGWKGQYQIRLSEKGDMLGTINNVKEFAKMAIDTYNEKRIDPRNLNNVTDEIYFGTNGLFQVYEKINNRRVQFSEIGVQKALKDRIVYDLITPVKDLFRLMKDEVRMDGGTTRFATLYDYASSLGRVRKDIMDIENKYSRKEGGVQLGAGNDWPLYLTSGIEFIKTAIGTTREGETNHPYIKFLHSAHEMLESSKRMEKGNPLADIIFAQSSEILHGKDMQEKFNRVAGTFVYNQSKALDLQKVGWQIKQIEEQMAFLLSKKPKHVDYEDSMDINARNYRDLGEQLEAQQEIRDTLSHALTWDENVKNIKATRADKFFKEEELGKTFKNKTQNTLLVYRKSDKNPVFEMVKPGKESFVRIRGGDLIHANPRRFEYVDTNEQMGLSGLFNAFAVPIRGITPQERLLAKYRADITKAKFGDSMDVVLSGVASPKEWTDHSTRLIDAMMEDFSHLHNSTKSSPDARDRIITQYIYNMLSPRPDQQVQGVTSVLTNTGRFDRRWRGPKYFRNDLYVKGMLHFLNSVANGSIKETWGLAQAEAKDKLEHVLERYTKHVLKVFDPTLPEHIAEIDREHQYRSRDRKGFIPPVSELPGWVNKEVLKNQESAGIFLDYLLGLDKLSTRELYDISMHIGREISLEAGASLSDQNAYVLKMAQSGRLGEVIENAWKIETEARDKYGRKVEIGSIQQAMALTKQARRNNFFVGHKQIGSNNSDTEQTLRDLFEEASRGCVKK